MQICQLPVEEQLEHFRSAVSRNQTLTKVLDTAAEMELPGWYLVAGCLYQTVWNVVTGQGPEAGILDYAVRVLPEREQIVDGLYAEAEQLAGQQILRQAPVASDLRLLLSVLRIAPELERSHDLVVEIASQAGRAGGQDLPPGIRSLAARVGELAVAWGGREQMPGMTATAQPCRPGVSGKSRWRTCTRA